MKKFHISTLLKRDALTAILSLALSLCIALIINDTFITKATIGTTNSSYHLFWDIYKKAFYNSQRYVGRKTHISLAPIDSCGRDDIARIIQALEERKVGVIGIDVVFEDQREGDTLLLSSIRDYDNIVLPLLVYDSDDTQYHSFSGSYFYDSDDFDDVGVVTQDIEGNNEVVRTFMPVVPIANSGVECFALKIASKYAPEAANVFYKRSEESGSRVYREQIMYKAKTLDTLRTMAFLNGDSLAFSGIDSTSIVLVGSLYNPKDMFVTPVSDHMPGLILHAQTTNTILKGDYTTSLPVIWEVIICIIILLVFFVADLYSRRRFGDFSGLVIRIVQACIFILLFYIGARLFLNNMTARVLLPIIITGLYSLSYDIVSGLIGLYTFVSKRFSK